MKLSLTLVSIYILTSSQTFAASSNALHPIDKNWEICSQAVVKAEKTSDIPRYLLNAISQVESGRWKSQKQENIAWPWTVTARGKGQFFSSKHKAVAETEKLLAQGVRNIDVGCMQINLMYHPDAFETLESAFDPDTNAQYGANYLKTTYEQTNDWHQAAAHYHSTTPTLAKNYKAKIQRLWSKNNLTLIATNSNPNTIKPGTPVRMEFQVSAIDRNFIERLNVAFQTRRQSNVLDVGTINILDQEKYRLEQMSTWRQYQYRGLNAAKLAIMHRKKPANQGSKLPNRASSVVRAKSFAKRRRLELVEWRSRRENIHNVRPSIR